VPVAINWRVILTQLVMMLLEPVHVAKKIVILPQAPVVLGQVLNVLVLLVKLLYVIVFFLLIFFSYSKCGTGSCETGQTCCSSNVCCWNNNGSCQLGVCVINCGGLNPCNGTCCPSGQICSNNRCKLPVFFFLALVIYLLFLTFSVWTCRQLLAE
jgi:hypothetical protein